jgi:hypothetical protein
VLRPMSLGAAVRWPLSLPCDASVAWGQMHISEPAEQNCGEAQLVVVTLQDASVDWMVWVLLQTLVGVQETATVAGVHAAAPPGPAQLAE